MAPQPTATLQPTATPTATPQPGPTPVMAIPEGKRGGTLRLAMVFQTFDFDFLGHGVLHAVSLSPNPPKEGVGLAS